MKELYLRRMKIVPPKIHILNYFVEKLNLILPKDLTDFIDSMDDAGVARRYPETLKEIGNKYKKDDTLIILTKAKEILDWTKEELKK